MMYLNLIEVINTDIFKVHLQTHDHVLNLNGHPYLYLAGILQDMSNEYLLR